MNETDRTTDADSDTESNSGIATEDGIDTPVTDPSLGQPNTDADERTGTSVGRRSVLAGLAGLGVLGTAAGSARAASTPLEFGGNYTADPGADWGLRLDPSNARFGLLGFSSATDGRGVVGRATSSTGETIGVIGRSDSSSDGAAGLMGFNDATTGRTYGFKGRSDSTGGRGALGIATADSGNTIGLEGRADSPSGVAVGGTNTAATGTTYGVLGQVNSPNGYGLYTPDDAKVDGAMVTVGDWQVHVDGDRALLLGPETAGRAGNVVAGHSSNHADSGVAATISGGGFDDGVTALPNQVTGWFGTVGGGAGHTVSEDVATIGGGGENTASAVGTTVSGGQQNTASITNAAIGGGARNVASGWGGTVGGGEDNTVSNGGATIGGGIQNTASGYRATVAGGTANTASDSRTTVGGGINNTASARWATVGGGWYNEVWGENATIAGGGPTDPNTPAATNNVVYDNWGTIGGGGGNRVGTNDGDPTSATFATVAGGIENTAADGNATVGGGALNTASGNVATVGGGYNNTASYYLATVSGGANNTASGQYSTVPGGSNNTADGDFSLAAGNLADTNGHAGAFVFGDSSGSPIQAQNDNEVRSQMPMYAPSFNSISARSAKTDFEPVDPQTVLESVASLEMSTWRFDHGDDARHMGPMAGEFHDAFGLGTDAEHIATVDADGVALAAIQGLAEKLDEKDDRIDDLEAENDALRERNADLETRLEAVEDHLGLGGTGGKPTAADD